MDQQVSHVVEAFWDREVVGGCRYTVPALQLSPEDVRAFAEARLDELPGIVIYPRSVLADIAGKEVLCLASGGGQQSVVFGLLGARVTVLDICAGQLEGDEATAQHYGYPIRTVKGDMGDLSVFADATFDLVYQPISIAFAPDVRVIYCEVHRVLKPGGQYVVHHCNPATHPTSFEGGENGWDGTGYRICEPYRGGPILSASGRENMLEGEPIGEHRHLLGDIFGGMLEIGFAIRDVMEDPRHLYGALQGEPGSHEHWLSCTAEYFGILARKGA